MTTERVLDDRYELLELIGSGGMADVWRAHDRRLGRDVAVKIMAGPAARDGSRRRRIEREAKALAAADHPNIVAVYDYGEEPSETGECVPFIVMELVDGPDLHRYLADRGPLPVEEMREIMAGVLAAVERAHAAGVVHGDLKPGNVFIGPHGPKVGDFGVARILGEETGTTTIAATPTFAAPEVLRGERASPASDVYSAACLGYELLAGRSPFDGSNGWEVAQKHLEAPPPRVRKARTDVPPDIDGAIARGMDKRPRKRFASASEFGSALGASVPSFAIDPVAEPAVEADEPRADLTVPVTAPSPSRSDSTEVISSAPRPDPAAAAVLGPLARVSSWWSSRNRAERTDGRTAAGRWSPLVAALVAVVLVLILGSLLLRDRSPAGVAVPDVTGQRLNAATAELSNAGFRVDVSYRPVTEGDPLIVLETIPGSDAMLEPGSDVHVIASALAATPRPVVTAPPADDDDDRGGEKRRGRAKRKRDRD